MENMKIHLLILFVALFAGCRPDKDYSSALDSLDKNERVIFQTAMNQISRHEIATYKEKINSLCSISRYLSSWESVRSLEQYKDMYSWLKNEVTNFPALFGYFFYVEKIDGEMLLVSGGLLWELAEELHPSVVADMRASDDFSDLHLIIRLIPLYH